MPKIHKGRWGERRPSGMSSAPCPLHESTFEEDGVSGKASRWRDAQAVLCQGGMKSVWSRAVLRQCIVRATQHQADQPECSKAEQLRIGYVAAVVWCGWLGDVCGSWKLINGGMMS